MEAPPPPATRHRHSKDAQAEDSQHIRLVAECRWDVITAPPLCSDFLVRCQIIKADEESGASAGTEVAAAVMMHVAMADMLGFHGNGDLSNGNGWIYSVAFDGHFEFSMLLFVYFFFSLASNPQVNMKRVALQTFSCRNHLWAQTQSQLGPNRKRGAVQSKQHFFNGKRRGGIHN